MGKSTKATNGKPAKPQKPHRDFALFPHASGRWCKKIRGKQHYFGKWTGDPDRGAMAALALYEAQATDLHAGRTPRPSSDGVTVRDLANKFLTAKRHALDAGEITNRTFRDYFAVCELVVNAFGKDRPLTDIGTDDFRALRLALSSRLGPVALGNQIRRVRTLFLFARDEGILDKAVIYGQAFKPPAKLVIRKHRAKSGLRMFEAKEIRMLLDAASVEMRAMILLGCNAALGNADIGRLPKSALNLDAGWLDFPRGKTGVARRIPLWDETIVAIRAAIAQRPKPRDTADAGLVFITATGLPWHRDTADTPVGKKFGRLCKHVGIDYRRGRSFYGLRHSFATVAGSSLDQPSINSIMGHSDSSMASTYVERIDDSRLLAVTNHVKAWLFDEEVSK